MTASAAPAHRTPPPRAPRLQASGAPGSPTPPRPAAAAAGRAFALGALLGALGLASTVVVITRLFASWRVSASAVHQIRVFGAQLSYPVANAGAIVVTVLAGLGALTAAATALAISRELLADRRFRAALSARSPTQLHGAWLIDDDRPQAFCAGLFRPRVYFSSATAEMLEAPALAAVLAHEGHHASRRDPLRLACARALVAGLFYLPGLRRLVHRQQALSELSADEAAVITAGGDRSALASAMLSFSQAGKDGAAGVDPERIDHLLGEHTSWRLPVALCLGAAAVLSVLTAIALLAAQAAAGSATLAPPLLSSRPCVAVLAMIPAAACAAGLAYTRGRRVRAR
jgi:Zn-dependent protease with chaperone function